MIDCYRSPWNGGSHDVYNRISNDSKFWSRGLEASDVGLWLVLLVSFEAKRITKMCMSQTF